MRQESLIHAVYWIGDASFPSRASPAASPHWSGYPAYTLFMRTSVARTAGTATRSHREIAVLAVFNDDNTTASTTPNFFYLMGKPSFCSVCRAIIKQCATSGKCFATSLLVPVLIPHTLQDKPIFLTTATMTTTLTMT
jgi:hypothetical protein